MIFGLIFGLLVYTVTAGLRVGRSRMAKCVAGSLKEGGWNCVLKISRIIPGFYCQLSYWQNTKENMLIFFLTNKRTSDTKKDHNIN